MWFWEQLDVVGSGGGCGKSGDSVTALAAERHSGLEKLRVGTLIYHSFMYSSHSIACSVWLALLMHCLIPSPTLTFSFIYSLAYSLILMLIGK